MTRRGAYARAAWALRVNRLLGAEREFAVARRFAAALRTDGWSGPVSPAQLSRWETGKTPLDYALVRRYEHLLGLVPYHLVTVVELIYREADRDSGVNPMPLDRGPSPATAALLERAETLLDQALSREPMTGVDWNQLSADLHALPQLVLYPRCRWDELAHRLLTELACTDGLPWIHRNEAVSRLLRHPRAAPAMIAASATLAGDPAHQTTLEPLCLLDITDHPDAVRLMLAQLDAPTSDQALAGALLAAVGAVGRRQLTDERLRTLTNRIALLHHPAPTSDLTWRLVPALLRALPPGFSTPAVEHLQRSVELDPRARTALITERITDPTVSAVIARRLAADASSRLSTDHDADDQMFPALIEDALFCADLTRRLQATLLVAATPYAAPLARSITTELSRVWPGGLSYVAAALLRFLSALRQPADRAVLERIVLTGGLHADVHAAAVRAAGRVPGRSSAAFWRTALQRHLADCRVVASPGQVEVLRRLVYAIGSSDHRRLLGAVAVDVGAPADIRAAAAWWVNARRR